ncbi:MAG: efflux RND transporter periplasmic adaptor subunit [Azospirillum sp.]|nr:efflux RND transporter periplasmic adaptor subunit [Azospirillum sp.]
MAPDQAQTKADLLRSLTIDRGDRSTPARRVWPGVLVGLLLGTGLGGAGVWTVLTGGWPLRPDETVAAASPPAPSTPSADAPAATAEPPRTGRLVASGFVVARRKATVAAEITGKVVEVLIDEGMSVTAGQVLARLDSVLADSDLALARSRVAAAEGARDAITADLREAERVLVRIEGLSRRNNASTAELTKAEAHVWVLQAQLAKATAEIETARLDAARASEMVDKHRIRAPFDGVVVERAAQPGEMISPLSAGGGFTRTGICTIVDMGSLEIEVDVNEAFIGRVRAGQTVDAVLDAYPGWTIPASVIAIVPTANRDKATVKVRIALKQADERVLPDMAVKVTFHDDGASASEPAFSATGDPA